jgi:hypothetical protein
MRAFRKADDGARRWWAAAAVMLAAVAVCLAAGPVVSGEATDAKGMGSAAPAGACDWEIVPTQNVNVYNELNGIDPLASDNAWAVGSSGQQDRGQQTLTQRWDGNSWSVVPSPNGGPTRNNLTDVIAFADNDAWAVGYYNDGQVGGTSETLAMHWDGTAWQIVPSPSPSDIRNELFDVSGPAANDLWAAGLHWQSGLQYHSLMLHWNGSAWAISPIPALGPGPGQLNSVSALDANTAWTGGSFGAFDGTEHAQMFRWDGTRWNQLDVPNHSGQNNYLHGIKAITPTDVWAVGYHCPGNCFGTNLMHPMSMHWDGQSWTLVPVLTVGEQSYLYDVTGNAPDNVWAVGAYEVGTSRFTLTMHWDGSAWTQVTSPNPELSGPALTDVEMLPDGALWSAGNYHFPGNPVFRTLVERKRAVCGSVTPAPPTVTRTATAVTTATVAATGTAEVTATNPPQATGTTTASATGTPVATATEQTTSTATMPAATATVAATATACVIEFSDVPPGSTFYAYVRCLACRGIVSGYVDGTYRPGGEITRGQISKVVANAAGFVEPVAGQTYADVAPGSTFYEFVERLASRQVMSGYVCGGPGEPCDGANRPYFRPGNGASRGQLSKIVSNAAGFSEVHTEVHYADVAVGDTFYQFVMRLTSRAVMGGYVCGQVAWEPCDGANRPYFRPGAAVTRGQAAKIVANTYLPACGDMGS